MFRHCRCHRTDERATMRRKQERSIERRWLLRHMNDDGCNTEIHKNKLREFVFGFDVLR